MLPTHCKDEDNFRNKYFNDFGWVVIRFSEKQVITNVHGCVLHIAMVIRSLMPNKFIIPDSLSQAYSLTERNVLGSLYCSKMDQRILQTNLLRSWHQN
ncbi:MAG: DUF559 domain-containing protein [Bacteroidetes bacterium]|nr:DUF559 domain-containing protein [Bacteroidota bacterium]